ncbi:uncharacterized protein TrAFT101_009822 [Trichoderma asperellum]|uniref:uncharacterized protein n=1 Tax=Trichoderma asperellum TaxID=101201 RepID=UPI00332F4673|nr:hypothetical protein TrAFT101_009822 [Trichoderma asperellum]
MPGSMIQHAVAETSSLRFTPCIQDSENPPRGTTGCEIRLIVRDVISGVYVAANN